MNTSLPATQLLIRYPDLLRLKFSEVPRDKECYVDANGSSCVFAFGMNCFGVISDERAEKYNISVLTASVNQLDE